MERQNCAHVQSVLAMRLPVRAALAVVAAGMLLGLSASAASAVSMSAGCGPGAGLQLAGQEVTSAEVSSLQSGLRCANLTGADLRGLSLVQVDFTGAQMRDANLHNDDLTQATLDGADLSGANLAGATLIQASLIHADLSGADLSQASLSQVRAKDANLSGANLSGVDLGQADLTGASLRNAKIGGANFIQATVDGTIFTGATGLPPYSVYLLIGACAVGALLVLDTLRRLRHLLAQGSRSAISAVPPVSPGMLVASGLISASLIAVGLHLLGGGALDVSAWAFETPLRQTCSTGPLCRIGLDSGPFGILIGFAVLCAGLWIRVAGIRATRRRLLRVGRLV